MNWLYEYILDLMNTLVVILFRRNRGSAMHTHTPNIIEFFMLKCTKECTKRFLLSTAQ